MKEVKRYKCDFCKTERATIKGIEKHEKHCVHNPKGFNCFNCELAIEDDIEGDYGYMVTNVPVCTYYEERITENIAEKCSEYKRTGKMYHTR